MKAIVKISILAGLIAVSVLFDDYIGRGVGVAVCVVSAIIGYMITERHESYGIFLFSISYGLGLIFFLLSLLVEVHIDDNGNNAIVRSRFWTQTLAEGKLEIKEIPYGYSTEYGIVHGVESDKFIFVYTKNNTCKICSRYGRLMELEMPYTFTERDFGDGKLQFLADADGHIFDFHGNVVEEDYVPLKVDHTMPDPMP